VLPLYGFVEGDTIGLLMLAQESQTVADLAAMLLRSASLRVAPISQLRVVHHERTIDPRLTVREAGFAALDRFDVVAGGE
jgi:hypothetical protein